jgi:hypothetical protein
MILINELRMRMIFVGKHERYDDNVIVHLPLLFLAS